MSSETRDRDKTDSNSDAASGKTLGAVKIAIAAKMKAAKPRGLPRILSAPNGVRTLTHRQIEQAVKKVLAERHRKDA